MSIEIDELRRLAELRDALLRKRNEFFEMRPTSQISDPAEKRFGGFVDNLLTTFDDTCSKLHDTFLDTSLSSDPAKEKIGKELLAGMLRGDDIGELIENLHTVSNVDKKEIKNILKNTEAVKMVAEQVWTEINEASIEAIKVERAALNSGKVSDQLKAAKSILDRAGYENNAFIELLREKEAVRGKKYTLGERKRLLADMLKVGERAGVLQVIKGGKDATG